MHERRWTCYTELMLLIFFIVHFPTGHCKSYEVIYAINAGGESHTDINGIHYDSDPITIGTASDYGKHLLISRCHQNDMILYQTERYHNSTFGYDIPIDESNVENYVMILKFSEVYFNAPNMKVKNLKL